MRQNVTDNRLRGYLTLLAAAFLFLFSCKKHDSGIPPTISYPAKNISFAVDAQMTPAQPNITGAVTLFAISPSLPKGITMDLATGIISGQASDTLSPTRFIVSAKGPNGVCHDTIMMAIGTNGFNYGMTPAYAFSKGDQTLSTTALAPTILAGSFKQFFISPDSLTLKTGLMFDPTTGKISGTPNQSTSTTASPMPIVFTVTGITTNNKATSTTVSITVNDIAPIYTYSTGSFKGTLVVGTNYVDSTTGTAPNVKTPLFPTSTGTAIKAYRLAPGSSALPAGLLLDSTTGRIYGNPTTPGTTTIILRALSAGGANPADVAVPITVSATAQAPIVSYFMIVTNKYLPSAGGSTVTTTDTIVSNVPSMSSLYLTNNTTISNAGSQGTYSGTSFQLVPITTAGQVASFSNISLTGLSIGSFGPGIVSGTPKITTATASATTTLTNAITGGATGSYTFNIANNAPYVTYNSTAGNIGSTAYAPTVGKSYAYSSTYCFIQNRAVNAAPNGTDSCYYTAAQLAPTVASGVTYAIYPAQMLPGLSFNTATGVISGTPTVNTEFSGNCNPVTYTIVAKKSDGSFTLFQVGIKVYASLANYQNKLIN